MNKMVTEGACRLSEDALLGKAIENKGAAPAAPLLCSATVLLQEPLYMISLPTFRFFINSSSSTISRSITSSHSLSVPRAACNFALKLI